MSNLNDQLSSLLAGVKKHYNLKNEEVGPKYTEFHRSGKKQPQQSPYKRGPKVIRKTVSEEALEYLE